MIGIQLDYCFSVLSSGPISFGASVLSIPVYGTALLEAKSWQILGAWADFSSIT